MTPTFPSASAPEHRPPRDCPVCSSHLVVTGCGCPECGTEDAIRRVLVDGGSSGTTLEKSGEWQVQQSRFQARYRPQATASLLGGAAIRCDGSGSGLKATLARSLEKKFGRPGTLGTSEGATIGSSERRKAMIASRSSSARWGSLAIQGGV
jgi:hypothetical protein